MAIPGARRGERGGGSSPPAGEGRRRHSEPLVSAGPRQRVRRAGPEVSCRGRRSSAFWSARGEEEKRVPGCGAWRGAGREEDGARCSSGAPGARGGVRSARAGRRAAGQSRGSRGPALRRAGRTRGRPLTPRAGGEGRRAAPRPGARQPPGRLWRAEDGAPARESGAILFAWLPGYGEAFVVPSLESLQLCNLLGFTRRCVQNESPFRSIAVASFPETWCTCRGLWSETVLLRRFTMSGKRKGV